MTKNEIIFLTHILDSIIAIEEYLEGLTEEQFHTTQKTQDAIIRRIEIIGEATKNISNEFREQNSNIPWKRMAGMRDVMIHQYFGIDYNVVWKTVTQFLPLLKEQIKVLLGEIDKK